VLQPELLELNEVVSGLERMLVRLLGEDVRIRTLPRREELDTVLADPGQLEQVIMNLVVNARDAMPQGGLLTLETAMAEVREEDPRAPFELRPGRYVVLTVSDTGVGMDAEVLRAHLRAVLHHQGEGQGTGLGLATVYGIVQQSGGGVTVSSSPGKGATFKVFLPSAGAAEVVRRAPRAEVVRGTETVLVVEDEEAVRRLAERILRSAGYRVLTAVSGGDALIACEREGGAVDLLLTDVVMPRMSGAELAERLRRQRPGLKVLFMSGYTDDAIDHHGVLRREVALIGKPFAAAALTAKVREILDAPQGGEGAT
jgi:two-component system cell cycle sensor histidine kinase/response regulator CckA